MTDDNETTSEPTPKWRALIRQNSEKIGTFAEEVVLPKHRRSMNKPKDYVVVPLPLRNVETDSSILQDTPIEKTSIIEMQKKYFPVFMISISVVQVIVICFMIKYKNNNPMLVFGYDPHRRYEVWRYFTIMLVHTRLSHLGTIVLLQLILGVLLEIVHNWSRIAMIYFASVIGGSLFITILNPNSYAVGASAGVYGLLFSHLSTIILNWTKMDKKFLRLMMLVIYVVFDIFINFQLAPDDADTNYASYLGGGMTGFLVSILVLKNFEKRQWKKKVKIVCFGIIASLAIIVIFVNIFACDLYLPTERNDDYRNSYEHFVYLRAIASPQASAARDKCNKIFKCKLLLNNGSFNGTTTTTQSY